MASVIHGLSNAESERQATFTIVQVDRVGLNFAAETKRTAQVAASETVIPYFQSNRVRVAVVEEGILGTAGIPREMALLNLVVNVDVVGRYRPAHPNPL